MAAITSLCVVLTSGCGRTAQPDVGHASVPRVVGEVVFVHPELAYVIVRGRDLPPDKEQATLERSGASVGTVRFEGSRQAPFAAADVVEGQPRVGDQVRQQR